MKAVNNVVRTEPRMAVSRKFHLDLTVEENTAQAFLLIFETRRVYLATMGYMYRIYFVFMGTLK